MRLSANLEQAGAAIGKLNSAIEGLAQSQAAMGNMLISVTSQLSQLTTQLQQVLSQKADIPTTTDKEAGERLSEKSKQEAEDG